MVLRLLGVMLIDGDDESYHGGLDAVEYQKSGLAPLVLHMSLNPKASGFHGVGIRV